jgi:hypothetical protein
MYYALKYPTVLVLNQSKSIRRVKIPKGYQNPYIEEQTTQWPKEKVQKDKQRSTKHAYKTKDRVT